ncbi:MAG: aminodeoxychorismate/anthranilate synthase component II [Alphaproteobacteria bacterium]|nr:aminodeoxychorismate/anthranilate synthase component II [Alphaproteobacteria bacterium]
MKQILLIDNYDSFTYNLVHYLSALGATVEVVRNDALSVADVLGKKPQGIVISPGPATPDEAGICLDLIRSNAGAIPLLGVCLGHQAIGQTYGGKVVRAQAVMHGKTSRMTHTGQGIFRGIPSPFIGTRYHSLIVERASLPDCLEVTAETEDGTIMGLQHVSQPVFGVQFHPESIASEHGHALLKNFVDIL